MLYSDSRCEYEDWLVVVGSVLQPVPLCTAAMSCPRIAKCLANLLKAMARDPRCSAHICVAPARAARPYPPSWLRAAAPSDPLLALPHQQLCQLWGDMVNLFIYTDTLIIVSKILHECILKGLLVFYFAFLFSARHFIELLL